ncbi:MAG: hypothetical protein WBF90_37695 [Rivularia sp. (in: cyanobacteria)]
MLKFKLPSYLLLGILGLSLPISTTITLSSIQPAYACRPAPGYKRSTLAQRVKAAPIVFQGVVTRIERSTLTIQVSEYFKNNVSKPKVVNLDGFNLTSCHDIISQPGTRYLFFATTRKGIWNAVYDGAYGSVRPWNSQTASELRKLGYIGMPPGSTSPKPPKPTPRPTEPGSDCVPDDRGLPCPV